jgi:hypothetical protein
MLRAIAYQLSQSVLVCLNLGPDELLFLEGAEDFDVVGPDVPLDGEAMKLILDRSAMLAVVGGQTHGGACIAPATRRTTKVLIDYLTIVCRLRALKFWIRRRTLLPRASSRLQTLQSPGSTSGTNEESPTISPHRETSSLHP